MLLRVKNQIGEDNLSIVAAGVASYAFPAIFPAIAALVSIALIAALPAALGNLGLPPALQITARIARWVVLAGVILFTLATVYRFAPDRENPRWRWVNWGAATATVLWLIGSWAFSFYVANFSNYNQTYSALGAVVILLLWFMLSAFVFLLGAEMNSEMEHQTSQDTTTGPEEPMGSRGAYHADTVGEKP